MILPVFDNVVAVKVKQVRVTDLPLPTYAKAGDAGMDLYSEIDFLLQPGERLLVPTGIAIQLPPYLQAEVRPRSGLANKRGVTVVNAPGTVDEGYTGEIHVGLVNLDKMPQAFSRGDRIAQLVVMPYITAVWDTETPFSETERGTGGFGSTGT